MRAEWDLLAGGLLAVNPGVAGLGAVLVAGGMRDEPAHRMCSSQMFQCPYCKYSNADVNRLRVHAMTQHSVQPMLRCPLCQDTLNNKIHLQLHLTHLHSVAPDCVEKLIMTVRQPGVVSFLLLQGSEVTQWHGRVCVAE